MSDAEARLIAAVLRWYELFRQAERDPRAVEPEQLSEAWGEMEERIQEVEEEHKA